MSDERGDEWKDAGGIWNVVGTPIERLLSSDEFIVFRVFYDPKEKAKKVDIQN